MKYGCASYQRRLFPADWKQVLLKERWQEKSCRSKRPKGRRFSYRDLHVGWSVVCVSVKFRELPNCEMVGITQRINHKINLLIADDPKVHGWGDHSSGLLFGSAPASNTLSSNTDSSYCHVYHRRIRNIEIDRIDAFISSVCWGVYSTCADGLIDSSSSLI